jgi:hypothetical protein
MDTFLRGPFAVPVQVPQQQMSTCLARTNESVAWQCASDTTFQLNILPSPKDFNITMITLGSVPSTNGTIYHGHQAPDISPVALSLLNGVASADNDGSTYYFRSTYNRVVLLKENDLTPDDKPRSQPVMRHPTFLSGETLWRCIFNESVVEGYIYPKKKTAASGMFNGTVAAVQNLPKIPYVLKLVEQRMPNGKGPYCERVQVQDGKLLVLSEEKVMLTLVEPAAEASATKVRLARSARYRPRQSKPGNNFCRCQWMVQ